MATELAAVGLADGAFEAKVERCAELIRLGGRAVVAFSAGVDSTCLLALAARTLGAENVLAAIGISASLPQRELVAARRLAQDIGVELVEVVTGEMADARYAANPTNRCYFCKHDLFGRLAVLAYERGYSAVLSGANADDVGDFRPGMQAAVELGVRSPLLEAGLTKAEIRTLSVRLNLPKIGRAHV